MDLPALTLLRQTAPQPCVAKPAAEVERQLHASGLRARLERGARVALAVGSRGIANLADIVKAAIDTLHGWGVKPFIVAAMGSHGGGTAFGQRQLLADYGINEEAMGVPVRTDMDVVQIGTNSWGEPVFWDKNAWEAEVVVAISRVKAHTDFRGHVESGIIKMLVIGLGKREGAAQHHRWGIRGLRDMLPETAHVVLAKTRFAAGLAILENAREETALIRYVDRADLLNQEPGLLEQAKALMGRLPFDQLDLLVIGEIGKNYSGAGIDPNVVGRLLLEGESEAQVPRIIRICALDLSPESHGNGTGVGIADLATERLLNQIDPAPFRLNNLTACFLWRSKLPFTFPTDRTCIETGLATCWQPRLPALRMAVIPNTLELEYLWVTPALVEEAGSRPHLEVAGEPQPLPFDKAGNLEQERLFPHCVRSRRLRNTDRSGSANNAPPAQAGNRLLTTG